MAGNKARALEYLAGRRGRPGVRRPRRRRQRLARTSAPPPPWPPRRWAWTASCCSRAAAPRPVPVNVALAAGRRRAAAVRGSAEPRPARRGGRRDARRRFGGQGRRPYAVPRGGATPVGRRRLRLCRRGARPPSATALGVDRPVVVVAAGSGGTQAGLVAGQVGFGLPWRTCRRVGEPAGADLAADGAGAGPRVRAPARAPGRRPPPTWTCATCRGPGFGIASGEDRVSAELALRREGLLLDDYYGAKAMTLLRYAARRGCPTAGRLLAHRRRRGRPGRPDRWDVDHDRHDDPAQRPTPGLGGPGAGRERLRAGERRRAVPAPRPEPRRHRPRAGPAARGHRPASRPRATCSRLLLEVAGHRARGLPLRPGVRRALQLPGAATSSSGSATSPAGCTPADPGGRRRGSPCGSTSATSCSSWSARSAVFAQAATVAGRPRTSTR